MNIDNIQIKDIKNIGTVIAGMRLHELDPQTTKWYTDKHGYDYKEFSFGQQIAKRLKSKKRVASCNIRDEKYTMCK